MSGVQSRDADGLHDGYLSFLPTGKHFRWNPPLSSLSPIDGPQYGASIHLVERSSGSHVFTLHESRRFAQVFLLIRWIVFNGFLLSFLN
jgi:hypothetical protein